MAKWPLNTGWPPNTGCKKHSSKNSISSADQISVWPQMETFISGFLMICENKQGNKEPHVLIDTVWSFNTG